MAQAFVQEAAIDDPDVVAEVARRAGDEVGRDRRRIDEPPSLSLTRPIVFSAVSRVRRRLGAVPVAVARSESVVAPPAIFVNRSRSSAANSALEAMKP